MPSLPSLRAKRTIHEIKQWRPRAAIPAKGKTTMATFRFGDQRSSYRPPQPAPENYRKPGALKKYLHSRGQSAVYLSEDHTAIISEHPDGSVDRYILPPEVQERLKPTKTFDEIMKEIEREEREKTEAGATAAVRDSSKSAARTGNGR